MKALQEKARASLPYLLTLLRWLALAVGIGLVCGVLGVAFHFLVDYVTELRAEHPWILYTLPLLGLCIAGLYWLAGYKTSQPGTDRIIESLGRKDAPPVRMAPLIFVGTVLTHLGGGSSGREGAALQIGGSVGGGIGRLLRLDKPNEHLAIMCGMSAVFSALFGTPLTATVFTMEVWDVGILHYSALLPCLLSSLTAAYLAQLAGVSPTAFFLPAVPSPAPLSALQVVALAALAALVSILFCTCMHTAGHLYAKYLPNPFLRAAVGGCLVAGTVWLLGTQEYCGAGMGVAEIAIEGSCQPYAFLVKMLLTALTLGAGFKGGEIVPSFFIGATFGCAVGPLLGLPASFGAAIGLVSVFCGVVNCPLASILLAIELFGPAGSILFALAVAVSNLLSGPYSLYSSQRFLCSKTLPIWQQGPLAEEGFASQAPEG